MPQDPSAFLPILEGVRILDLSRAIAGPASTMLAAELGAEVIKVEPPGGDEMRNWPPFVEGQSVYFVSCNRGKRSISLNLKSAEGKKVFMELLSRSDVLVENYRPGTLERMGLGWEDLKAAHPKLVWVSVTGYGRTGPRAQAPAYDTMMQAYVGVMGITGEADGPPARGGGSPIDIATSYLALSAIMSGVHAVSKTGRGILMETSLMEAGLGFMHSYLQATLAQLPVPGRLGSETMGMYPVGTFTTSDNEFCLAQVSNEIQWQKFCQILGAPELLSDERFTANPDRVRNRDALRPLIQERFSTSTAHEWETVFIAAGVPVSHVRKTTDVAKDEQILARDMIKPVRLPSGNEVPSWGMPLKINEGVSQRTLAVPDFDQHRDEILNEIGLPNNVDA